MKTRLLLSVCVLFTSLLTSYRTTAQTVDPSFSPSEIYYPAQVRAAVFQPDGKRLVVGDFVRTDAGNTSSPLLRYNADNTLDQAFTANVASLRGNLYNVRVLTSGKLLLIGDGPLTLGTLTRQDVLRLNVDGTPDASFDAGSASGTGRGTVSAVQPDGRIVLGGTFESYNGIAAQKIVRLLPDGAVDATFSAGTLFTNWIEEIVLQPDGKVLVGGDLRNVGGIVRLLPNGVRDNTFMSSLGQGDATGGYSRVSVIGVQPDGKIVITTGHYQLKLAVGPSKSASVIRLLPDGSVDPSFSLDERSNALVDNLYDSNEILFQPDGKILVPVCYRDQNQRASNGVVRLNADGTYDPAFPGLLPQTSEYQVSVNSLTRNTNGQLLIAGLGFNRAGYRHNTLLLNPDGSIAADFKPLLLGAGIVGSLVQQPDGKLLVAGRFDEVAGTPRNGLVRLNLDGTLDAAFSTTLAPFDYVGKTVVQPDGKILLQQGYSLLRVLASGARDNTWQLPVNESVYDFVVQPDGRIVTINFDDSSIKRFLPDGQADNSFVALASANPSVLLLQPDGKIVVGGFWDKYNGITSPSVIRLLNNGAVDASFTSPVPVGLRIDVQGLALQPDGKLLAFGYPYPESPATQRFALFRMQPNGALDNSFAATMPTVTGPWSIVRQPNGRILVAAASSGVLRQLDNGQSDPSFGSVSTNNRALAVLVQTDGKLLVGGDFNTVNGQRALSLVRLRAPNVLRTSASLVQAPTDLWPNPAHDALHVQVDATAQPQRLELLDATGRVVVSQAVREAEPIVSVSQLRAGLYLLRVTYADGPVVRRVVVE